ncbi:hypothetical protein C4573_05745 [Candidatus Woesearchaeota archaeon]|nr:MAG: hypothetical protein C4573_05745 [Candidatus Woesearchaeota archaeon]
MQIIIDTQKDSKEDIEKAIAFLKSLTGALPQPSNEGFVNIFDMPKSELKEPEQKQEPEKKKNTDADEKLFDDKFEIITY